MKNALFQATEWPIFFCENDVKIPKKFRRSYPWAWLLRSMFKKSRQLRMYPHTVWF